MLFNIFWLILLLIINSVQTKSIYLDSVLGDQCKTNEECVNLVSNSMCLNKKCVCRLGYKFDGMFRCIFERRYRRQINFESLGTRMLGEECESNDQCRRTPVDGTKVCLANQCQCSSGHVPIDAYRCIRDFEQQVSSNTQSTETEEPPGYGSLCSTTSDCQHSTVQLECFRGTCVCLEGYVPLGKYLCYNIRGQGAPVIESSTLTTTTTFDLPNNEMIKSVGQTCINDDYCQRSASHSHCSNGKCTCLDGYLSLDHDTCIESSSIVDLKNNLNEDSTTSSSHYRSLLGGQCLTNRNCHTTNARCLNNICICPMGSFPIDDWNCLEDLDSVKFEPTTIISPPLTTTATTVFHWWPWTLSTTTHQSLIDSKNTFHFRCLLNRQCISIDENSHCTVLGRCVCNIGYKLDMTSKEQICVRHIINEENCD